MGENKVSNLPEGYLNPKFPRDLKGILDEGRNWTTVLASWPESPLFNPELTHDEQVILSAVSSMCMARIVLGEDAGCTEDERSATAARRNAHPMTKRWGLLQVAVGEVASANSLLHLVNSDEVVAQALEVLKHEPPELTVV